MRVLKYTKTVCQLRKNKIRFRKKKDWKNNLRQFLERSELFKIACRKLSIYLYVEEL